VALTRLICSPTLKYVAVAVTIKPLLVLMWVAFSDKLRLGKIKMKIKVKMKIYLLCNCEWLKCYSATSITVINVQNCSLYTR